MKRFSPGMTLWMVIIIKLHVRLGVRSLLGGIAVIVWMFHVKCEILPVCAEQYGALQAFHLHVLNSIFSVNVTKDQVNMILYVTADCKV